MAPLAEIALALEATGFSQDQNTGSEHFVRDPGRKLPASLDRIPNYSSRLVPSRGYHRENDLIDLRLGCGPRKSNLIPPQRAIDFGKLFKRDQVGKSIENRLQQLGIELDNERPKRGGILIILDFKNSCCCFRLIEFVSSLKQVF